MKSFGVLSWEMTSPRDFERPVIHRVCAWCGQDLGDVACAPEHLEQAGETTHGICYRCMKAVLAGIPQMPPDNQRSA